MAALLQSVLNQFLQAELPRLEHLWVDAGYGGAPFAEWAAETGGWTVEVVRKAEDGSFQVLKAPMGGRAHVCVALQVPPAQSAPAGHLPRRV